MTRYSGKLALLIALLLICALGFRWLWMGWPIKPVTWAGAVVASAGILVYRKRSPWLREHEFLMITMLAIILHTAVISTVMLDADNERYRIPAQPPTTTWLVWTAASWLTSGRQEVDH